MWKASPAFKISILWPALLGIASASFAGAEGLQEFENCIYLPESWADGDSFHVFFPDGKKRVLRLYYIDCVEQTVQTDSDKDRLREQARHFGTEDYRIAVEHGEAAAAFTAKLLEKPFTVHTAFADARGRSGKPRYYAFIRTHDGRDLARVLVEEGLARAFGVGRETPSGTSRDEYEAFLEDVEFSAAMKRNGLWAHSDPEALVAMRADERREARELEAIDAAVAVRPPEEPIDVNSGSLEDLMRAGLREGLADGVIQNRFYERVEDIIRVKGIGPKTLEKVKPYLFAVTPQGRETDRERYAP